MRMNVKIDDKALLDNLDLISRNSAKNLRVVVSDMSQQLKQKMQDEINTAVDRPNPFTTKAMHSTRAFSNGNTTEASVFIKDIQADYLDKQLNDSSSKRKTKDTLLPVSPRKINKYGNLKGKRRINTLVKTNKNVFTLPSKKDPSKKVFLQRFKSKNRPNEVIAIEHTNKKYHQLFSFKPTAYKHLNQMGFLDKAMQRVLNR